jgi:hypothetical protein
MEKLTQNLLKPLIKKLFLAHAKIGTDLDKGVRGRGARRRIRLGAEKSPWASNRERSGTT